MSYNYSTTASPPSPTSSSSSFSSGPPQTPTSPSGSSRRLSAEYQPSLIIPSLPEYGEYTAKPKPNTAERRASHNAVERARRETLNGRFLDLAALLPNLKHLRRPSKSAIVNSSIAHVRAARRYRQLASHQLRALNAECDMVRHEVNQWRARAGMRPVDTPARSEAFTLVMGGEEPAFDPVDLEGEDDEDADFVRSLPHRRITSREPACEGPLLLSDPYAPVANPPTPPHQQQLIHATPPHHVQVHSHTGSPEIAVSFETPNQYDGFLPHQQGDVWYAPTQSAQLTW
ncbi:hypothetical protein FB45DRAFT_1006978 [Roridomyces roridus]|uniref:BHLH domain-containing protein n=1 Tax=Roridomyces roridus TaxID=1738132 RepID=A0AAD7F7R1_9AGAR|nr:hypothetical protein FB45DRAFT_1011396 [Roridomyces roridus]KAJ7619266.1 hypothetical protein FB45DRAFT_1006978 [Roridomyces roridus]